MKDHRHVLGRLVELATVLDRTRKVVSDAIDRLSSGSRDEGAVSETIGMMEDMNDELGEAQEMSQGILSALAEEVAEEGGEVDGEDEE